MATQVVTRVLDDIDHTVLGEGGEPIVGERILYGYQGKTYQIDLKPEHAAEFHRLLAYWVEHSVVVDAPKRRKPKPEVAKSAAEPEVGKPKSKRRPGIRAWALEQGYDVNPRGGRIPLKVEEAYDRATGAA